MTCRVTMATGGHISGEFYHVKSRTLMHPGHGSESTNPHSHLLIGKEKSKTAVYQPQN